MYLCAKLFRQLAWGQLGRYKLPAISVVAGSSEHFEFSFELPLVISGRSLYPSSITLAELKFEILAG